MKIDQLRLDADNPRFEHAANQHDSLQRVIDDQGEKLFVLAESIANDGMNPMDRLAVVRESPKSEQYRVVEGNRRVAALRILKNPSVLTGLHLPASLRKRLEAVAATFDPKKIEPLAAFEFANETEANQWIFLRHTGENEGRGVVAWNGVATKRFRGSHPALQALDFVRTHGNLTDDEQKRLGNDFPITTLDRLLSAVDVRKRIGVEVEDKKLMTTLPADQAIKALRRIVLDLANKAVNVSQLKNRKQQKEYLDTFGVESLPDFTKTAASRPVENFMATEFTTRETADTGSGSKDSLGTTSAKKPAKRSNADPSERKRLMARTCRLNVQDPKTARIFTELRKLQVDLHPNAIAVLLRVFLELSVDHYLEKAKIPLQSTDPKAGNRDKTLKAKLQDVIDDLVKYHGAKKRDFAGVSRALSVQHSPLYVDLLHAYVHNRFVIPNARDLTAAWDEAQPFFEQVWP